VSWGGSLIELGKRENGDPAARLFAEAEEKLTAAMQLDPTLTYNIACLSALQGDESKCREYLENAEHSGTLPHIAIVSADADFNSVRDKSWFQELLARRKTG
jgi:hypothetical protein